MFVIHQCDGGYMPGLKLLPAEAITPKVGLCLKLDATSGQLEVSDTPQFICMTETASAVTTGTPIAVIPITRDIVFESELDGATSLKVGALVDVDSTGLLIDADSTSDAVFRIEWLEGTAAGSKVRGRFVK